MTQDDFKQQNHKIIDEFLSKTQNIFCDSWDSIKCTIAQFLLNTTAELNHISKINGGYVTPEDIIECQIKELRRCVADLSQHEGFIKNPKEELQ